MPRLFRRHFIAVALFASAIAAPGPLLAAGQGAAGSAIAGQGGARQGLGPVSGPIAVIRPQMRPPSASTPQLGDRIANRHAGRHDPHHIRIFDAYGHQRPGLRQGRKPSVTVGGGLWLAPYRPGQAVFVAEPLRGGPIARPWRVRNVTELPVAIGIRRAAEALSLIHI